MARRVLPSFDIDGQRYYVVPEAEAVAAGLAGATKTHRRRTAAARKVRAARLASGLSQAQLAARLDVSAVRISRIETGADGISDAYLAKVLEALDLPLDWQAPK